MSSSLPAKRRRLNQSLNALNKPFVSPLKTPKKNEDGSTVHQKASTSALATDPSEDASTTNSRPARFIAFGETPTSKSAALRNTSKSIDPVEATAQKALTSLELEIRNIRNEIDSLNQAAQIRASTTDDRLENLTQKWRVAAQAAADEVFESVKDRVAQMGGVQAWRESERNKHSWSTDLDEPKNEAKRNDSDYEFDSDGELLSEDKLEYRKAENRKWRQEIEQSVDVDESVEEGGDGPKNCSHMEDLEGDDTFTMDVMLRSLNIELGVIGYDKSTQTWVT